MTLTPEQLNNVKIRVIAAIESYINTSSEIVPSALISQITSDVAENYYYTGSAGMVSAAPEKTRIDELLFGWKAILQKYRRLPN